MGAIQIGRFLSQIATRLTRRLLLICALYFWQTHIRQ